MLTAAATACRAPSYLLEVLVAVDVLLVVRVLQLVGFNVLPQRLDDAGAGLRVDAQQASQPGVQLELGGLRRPSRPCQEADQVGLANTAAPSRDGPAYLVVQHQQQSAAHAHVSGTLHLEAVRLLRGGRAVPLKAKTQPDTINPSSATLCLGLISTLTG